MIGVASTAVECTSRKSSAAHTSPAHARSMLGRSPPPRLRHSVRRRAAASAASMRSVRESTPARDRGADGTNAVATRSPRRETTRSRQTVRSCRGGGYPADGAVTRAMSNNQNRKYKKRANLSPRAKPMTSVVGCEHKSGAVCARHAAQTPATPRPPPSSPDQTLTPSWESARGISRSMVGAVAASLRPAKHLKFCQLSVSTW